MFIRDAPASKLPGKWKLELFMNRRLAVSKEIIIGDPSAKYEKIDLGKDSPAIGVVRFIPKGGERKQFASWNLARGDKTNWLSWNAAIWLAQMFCVEYPSCRVIGPRAIERQITLPTIMELDVFTESLLKSQTFAEMVDNENISLVVLGSLYRASRKGERTTYEIAIVDSKSKKVVKRLKTYWKLDRDYKEQPGQKQSGEYVSHQCKKVYKEIMENANKEIISILQKNSKL
jgi:hypothetical protein